MPKNNKSFQKSLQIYLSSKLKKPMPTQLPIHPNSMQTTSNWILSGCRHPKTSSFSVDRSQFNGRKDGDDNDAATLTDVDRFLCENFKSLYCNTNRDEDKGSVTNRRRESYSPRTFLFESPRLGESPPEIHPSNRFFVSTNTSNSLLEESRSGSSSTTQTRSTMTKSPEFDLPEDTIAVFTNTQDPYEDFLQSMVEMVEARSSQHEDVDWDFMEELLFCYLELNEKRFYKYILEAFVDLIVILRQISSSSPENPREIQPKTRTTKTKTQKRRKRRKKGAVT